MGKVLTKGRDVCCEVNAGGSLYGRIWVGKFVWERRGERAFLLWAQGGRVIVSARDQTVRAQKVEERGRHSPVPPSSPQVIGPQSTQSPSPVLAQQSLVQTGHSYRPPTHTHRQTDRHTHTPHTTHTTHNTHTTPDIAGVQNYVTRQRALPGVPSNKIGRHLLRSTHGSGRHVLSALARSTTCACLKYYFPEFRAPFSLDAL